MKPLLLTPVFLCLVITLNAQVAINSNNASPDSSAMLDVQSSDKGLLIPRMTAAQRMAIGSPAAGLLLYQTDGAKGLWFYDGSGWMIGSVFTISGDTISNGNGDYTSDKFVVGSPSLDYTGEFDHAARMFFDKGKAAFRAGVANNANWDYDSLGVFSFASGRNTKAIGNWSASFGELSTASAQAAFATGVSTIASNLCATAMGHQTTASGTVSTAAGIQTIASGAFSTALGNQTSALGGSSTAMGFFSTSAGSNSTAMGVNTLASSWATTSMGYNTIASDTNATSMGFKTLASGHTSTAMGDSTTASGLASTAMGNSTKAYGANSTALGSETVAVGNSATSMGYSTRANGQYSTALGKETVAQGTSSTSLGWNTTATGSYSLSAGKDTESSGLASTSLGNSTEATGAYSTAMGWSTDADGSYATSMGFATLADGTGSFAMGSITKAIGSYSTAMGSGSEANGRNSTAMGKNTVANGYASTVIGMFNEPIITPQDTASDTAPLFIVGNGDGGALSNAMVVRKDGRVGIGISAPRYNLHVGDGNINATNHSQTRIAVTDSVRGNRAAFLGLTYTSNGSKIEAQLEANGNNNAGPSVIVGSSTPHPLFLRTGNITRMIITTGGNVGIADMSPAYRLEVNGDINALGNVRASGVVLTSDVRFKNNIKPIPNALSALMQLNGVYYMWDINRFPNRGFKSTRDIGVIAQDVENVLPELISTDHEGYKSVDYSKLTAVLIESIKEQQLQIDHQQQEIEALKTLTLALKSALKNMSNLNE